MKLFKEGELKLLWPFYLASLVSPIFFFFQAFVIVYFRNLGFSLFEISVLTMMMPLSMLLFEIPTGAFADIFGRKFSVLIGLFIEGSAIFSIFFLQNYFFLLFAFSMIGFGSTFISGAEEAWVIDLIKNKKKDFLHGFLAKKSSMIGFSVIFSGFVGAFLVKTFGISIIWIAGGFGMLLYIIFLSFAEESFVKRKVKTKTSFKKIVGQSIKSINFSRKHHVLFYFLLASSIVVFAGVFNGDLAWITFLQEMGFPDYAFGYMWSAMGLVAMFAPLISLKFMKKRKERQFILITTMLLILALSLIIFVSNIGFAILVLLSSIFLAQMSTPAERIYFHRFIPSKLRATIGSVEKMLIGIIGLVAMPLAGLSVDFIGAKYTLLLSAIIMIPAVIIYFKIKE